MEIIQHLPGCGSCADNWGVIVRAVGGCLAGGRI